MSFVIFLLIIGGLLLLASIHFDEDGVVLNASTIVSDVFRIIVFLALVLVADFVFKAFFLNQNYSWKEIIRSIIQSVFYIIKTGFVDIYNIFLI
ncbi:TPA: hypothetical protein EYG84_00385 [Candidatus Gracilibacteria bacterium]|nr:hypothetical protein [Candidatus Gracilibacteria bacterium]